MHPGSSETCLVPSSLPVVNTPWGFKKWPFSRGTSSLHTSFKPLAFVVRLLLGGRNYPPSLKERLKKDMV